MYKSLIKYLLLSLLLLLTSLVSLTGNWLTTLGTCTNKIIDWTIKIITFSTFRRRVHSVFELGNLFTEVDHDGVAGRKIFFEQLSVALLELDLEPPSEHLLLTPLTGVIFPLDNVSFPHLVTSVIQHHLDLLVGRVLAALVQSNPPTLVDALLAVEVGGVDADEPLRVGVELVFVEGSHHRLRRASHRALGRALRLRGEASDCCHLSERFLALGSQFYHDRFSRSISSSLSNSSLSSLIRGWVTLSCA